MNIYEPQDDSYLLEKEVRSVVRKDMNVLDMGTGSGILARAAAEQGAEVVAADINPKAIEFVTEDAKEKNLSITTVLSDLFEKVDGKYDLIIFNPPYLPSEEKDPDIALDGGEGGFEIIERFLDAAGKHLAPGGSILLLFSTLSNFERVLSSIKKNAFIAEERAQLAMFFERLYVYRLTQVKQEKE